MSQKNQQLTIDFHLEPEYTFNNFVKTPSTKMAYNASLFVARKPGRYNPLIIYGGKGVGKTHLLRAIGNKARSNLRDAEIVYVSSKNILLADHENSKSEFDMVSLVDRYKNADFLIIDDIDVVLKKPCLDEKIFHLYNHLIQGGKQLIFSSSTPPQQLNFSDLNLISRLRSGLSVKIEKMNDEDKRKVIKKLSKDFEIFIPDIVVDHILNSASRDFKSLYGIIGQLNKLSLETKKKITLSLAKKTLNT